MNMMRLNRFGYVMLLLFFAIFADLAKAAKENDEQCDSARRAPLYWGLPHTYTPPALSWDTALMIGLTGNKFSGISAGTSLTKAFFASLLCETVTPIGERVANSLKAFVDFVFNACIGFFSDKNVAAGVVRQISSGANSLLTGLQTARNQFESRGATGRAMSMRGSSRGDAPEGEAGPSCQEDAAKNAVIARIKILMAMVESCKLRLKDKGSQVVDNLTLMSDTLSELEKIVQRTGSLKELVDTEKLADIALLINTIDSACEAIYFNLDLSAEGQDREKLPSSSGRRSFNRRQDY